MTRAISAERNSIWLAVGPAAVVPLLGSLLYFVVLDKSLFAQYAYMGTKVFTLLWPLIAITILMSEPMPLPNVLHVKNPWTIIHGIVSGAAIVLIMFGIMQTPLGNAILDSSGAIREKSGKLGVLEYYWSFTLFLCLFHSLIEEYYWRWFVFGNIKRVLNPAAAHTLAGIAFAAHHIVVATQFFPLPTDIMLGSLVGVGGMIWSNMYIRHESLAGAWVSHMIVDLGIMVIGHMILFGGYI